MKNFWSNYLENNTFFWVFSVIGTVLIIAAFLLPPLAVIDNSVLIAVGEINGCIALGCVCKAIDKGVSTTFKKGDTEIEIRKDEE